MGVKGGARDRENRGVPRGARGCAFVGREQLGPRRRLGSTGGGAWLRAENRDLIRRKGLSVWLNVDLETLWNRVRMRSTRPLLKTADPKGTLTTMLESRRPHYATAELVFDVQGGDSIDQTASRLLSQIRATHPECIGVK